MTRPVDDEGAELPAGRFGAWIRDMQRALRGEGDSEVPCGGCTACCTSSQFVHIAPDETETLARIPGELLFPAPLLPAGHVLLGYDESGRCPMLIDDRCSIYEHRPRTCRVYDCRVFAAAGVALEGSEKAGIARRVARWRFAFPDEADRRHARAAEAAAVFLAAHEDQLTDTPGAMSPGRLAVLAVEIHDLFLGADGAGLVEPPLDDVRAALQGRSGA